MNMDYLKDHNILILKIKANGIFSDFVLKDSTIVNEIKELYCSDYDIDV